MAEKRTLDLSAKGKRKSKSGEEAAAQEAKQSAVKARSRAVVVDEDDDEDDEILADVPERGKNKNTMLFIVAGIALVVVIVFVFLLMGGKKSSPSQGDPGTVPQESGSVASGNVNQAPSGGVQTSGSAGSELPNGLGTQDFTGNTNMSNSDVLTDPNKYIEDLYGLTTRVDYTVKSISEVADFVSYTKHRGTWGGGLELYWLEAEYKNRQYVVQVPFKYYKELDDVGIVPVKMEVLTIQGTTEGETLTVISYMCLDEGTLKDILKQQAKSR